MNMFQHVTQLYAVLSRSIVAWWSTVKTWASAHKVWAAVIVLVVLGGGWWAYARATSTSGTTRYVLGTVSRNTIVASISATGQVSSSQQLDLKPTVSGQILAVGVSAGQKVKAGTRIVEIDPTAALKSVRDAQASLQSAQIALAKLKEPPTTLTLTQQQNALQTAQNDLAKAYANAQTDMSNAFLDMPSIVTGLQDVELGTTASKGNQWNIDYYKNQIQNNNVNASSYRDIAYNDFIAAQNSYNKSFADFQTKSSSTNQTDIENLLQEVYATTQLITKAVKSGNALVQLYEDTLKTQNLTPSTVADTQLTSLSGYTSKVNTANSNLLADSNTITTDKQNITVNQQTLAQTQMGADPLDLQSAQLNVTKAQNAVQDAQNTLANYYVRAPFDATVAVVNVKKYDQSGSTAVATLITNQQIAQLNLNEVDAAKIKIGDKATLTFDAIPTLTLTGSVVEIDPVGTVTQGVVTYVVKISFDSQDSRIKAGMTVNAAIQTDVHPDVLEVPQSAVKTQNGTSVVMVFDPPLATSSAQNTSGVVSSVAPTAVQVQTGIADDTNIEITSGLTEGEQIVTRTTAGSATTQTRTTTTGGAGAARGGFGGGGIRIGG